MSKKISDLSPSMQIAAKTVYAIFKILKDAGGHLPGREVIDKIRKTVEFNDWEKHQYEKTGYIRWESILHFYTVGCIKLGADDYLTKPYEYDEILSSIIKYMR